MKSFKKFLCEMPFVSNSELTKDEAKNNNKRLRSALVKGGNEVDRGVHHALDADGVHLYGSGERGKFKTIHAIDSEHKQIYVSKTDIGSSHDALNIMNHHVQKHGKLISDNIQTKGGKTLWEKWIKSKPSNTKFHYSYYDRDKGKISVPIDHYNLDRHEKHIWSGGDAVRTRLHATKSEG